MAVAIRIENLNKSFGSVRAVDHVNLAIEPGELFFLLGPSGCGKTTLLRCVAGFCIPDEGSIRIGERDITRLPPYERDAGMVFQSYALWPHMSVGENIAFGLEMRGVPPDERRQRVAEALAMVKMSERADHRPNQLSGGQQQRVALARALVIRPQCLLLDEPLSNLDAKLRVEMRSEIRRICKQAGLTAIYVTHDQKESLSIADRLAVMDEGCIRQCGRPQDVYLRPDSRFVASFIGETNFVEASVAGATGQTLSATTSIGQIVSAAPPSAPVKVDQRITLSIRPEVIHFGNPPPGVNVFDGTVHDTVYLGEMAQHQVDIASGSAPWKVFDLNPRILARDRNTERTRVWFRPEDVVVLTR